MFEGIKKLKRKFDLKLINYHIKNYDISNDLSLNEKKLDEFGFNIAAIKEILKKLDKDYFDPNLSWHYHYIAGYFHKFQTENKKILEIGTHNGDYTNFLSKLFSGSEIHSFDLKHDKVNTKNFDLEKKEKDRIDLFFLKRKKNLEQKNIKFYETSSFYLSEYFSNESFDIIFVDGDHLNPQVTIDIFQGYKLLKDKGIMMNDDLKIKNLSNITSNSGMIGRYLQFFKGKVEFVNSDSSNTLDYLEKMKLIKNDFLIKNVRKRSKIGKKFVGISKKLNR